MLETLIITFFVCCVVGVLWDFLRQCQFRPYKNLSYEELNEIYQITESKTLRSMVADEIILREKTDS